MKQNIMLICSDQHNPFITGCYGDQIVETPNLDRLAREGTVFDAAYCNSPLCGPSRMSLMTGNFPFKIGVFGNSCCLNSAIPTFAHIAVAGAYHTTLIGRMDFRGPDQSHGYLERHIGELFPASIWGGNVSFAPLPEYLGSMSKPNPLETVGAGNTCYLDYDRDVTKVASNWLQNYEKRQPQRPFLMTVGYLSPHCPYIAPPELYSKYAGKVPPPPELTKELVNNLHPLNQDYLRKSGIDQVSQANKIKAKTAYFGLVDFLDQQIGNLLQTLEDCDLLDNTIIVYMSDHGEMLGEHGLWHKGCFYEQSARVPLIVRMPDENAAGKRVAQNVSLVDLFPTICDWVGEHPEYPLAGQSLNPLLEGRNVNRQNLVKAEYYAGDCRRMIVKGHWKLSYYSNSSLVELFNLAEDPGEYNNLAKDPDCQTVLNELSKELYADGWHNKVFSDNEEKLQQFGYYDWLLGKFYQGADAPCNADYIHNYWRPKKNSNWLSTETTIKNKS